MNDKAHFHLTDTVNKQNCHYWALLGVNPHIIHKNPLHNLCVTVWAGVPVWGIVGPFFFDNNINMEQYINMTETFLVSFLHTRCKVWSAWFPHDGTTCHIAT